MHNLHPSVVPSDSGSGSSRLKRSSRNDDSGGLLPICHIPIAYIDTGPSVLVQGGLVAIRVSPGPDTACAICGALAKDHKKDS